MGLEPRLRGERAWLLVFVMFSAEAFLMEKYTLAGDPTMLERERRYRMFGCVNQDEAFGAQACTVGQLTWPDQERLTSETTSRACNLPRLCALELMLCRRSTLHPIRGVNKLLYMGTATCVSRYGLLQPTLSCMCYLKARQRYRGQAGEQQVRNVCYPGYR